MAYITLVLFPVQNISCYACILTKSGLRRVRNCVGELALRFEMVASFYVCQPYHSCSHFMFSLHSDPTRAIVVTGMLHCVWSELPRQGVPYSIIHRLVATQFS